MATIPKPDELGINQPSYVGKAVAAPRANLYEPQQGEAAMALLDQERERLDNKELADAQTQFQLAALEETEKAANDSDIDTVEQRYQGAMMDQLGKAGAHISNGEVRQAFMQKGQVTVAESQVRMNSQVQGKKNDRERGYMMNAIQTMVRGGMNLEYGDPGEAALGIQLSLDSMVERQVISNTDAQAMMRTAQTDMAMGRLKAMDPGSRMAALEENWAKNLPPDVLKKLKDETEGEMVYEIAQDFAYELAQAKDQTGAPIDTYKANLEIYNAFKDKPMGAEIIRAARTEFGLVVQQREASIAANAIDIYNDVDMDVRTKIPPISIAQLYDPAGPYRAQVEKMDAGQRNNLEAYLTRKAQGVVRTSSDRNTMYALRNLYAQGPEKRMEALKYFTANWEKFNDTDWKFWNKELIQGEVTGLFDAQTTLLKHTEKWGWKKQAAMFSGLNKWYMGYSEQYGAAPSDADVQKQIDRALLDVTREDWYRTEKTPYEMNHDERVTTFGEMGRQTGKPAAQIKLEREEFLANYAPNDRREIQFDYLRTLNETKFDELFGRWAAEGKPFDYDTFEAEFLGNQ